MISRTLDRILDRTLSRALGLLLCCTACASALAGLRTGLAIGEIEGAGWLLSDVRIELDSDDKSAAGAVFASRIRAPGSTAELQDVHLDCAKLRASATGIQCDDGLLKLGGKAVTRIISLDVRYGDERWTLKSRLRGVQLDAISTLAATLAPTLPPWSVAGKALINVELAGGGAGPMTGKVHIDTKDLTLANADSSIASDSLATTLDLQFNSDSKATAFTVHAQLRGGYGYVMPVLQDYASFPASLQLDASWDTRRSRLKVRALRWKQPGVGSLRAKGVLAPDTPTLLESLQLDVEQASFPGLYSQAMEPYLAGTPLDELNTAGRLSGSAQFTAGALSALTLDLAGLHLDDRSRRFAVYGLDGHIDWAVQSAERSPNANLNPSQRRTPASRLSWNGIYLGRMPFGHGRWEFVTRGAELTATSTLRMDFFDGVIAVDKFHGRDLGTDAQRVNFEAKLEPVSLPLVTSALGWPSFPGKLAGRLPPVEFSNQQLRVDGALSAEAFGGTLTVDQLVVDEPLGLVPRARAEVRLRQLDLSQLTSVFDFGRIEGRLDADVSGLLLEAWLPAAFAARLYTSPGDDARHRISQRAVNNISRVGGGGAVAALSNSFLRFFESFGYKRIGWSCTLRKGVCEMNGIRPAQNGKGYYIVEGKGLPRIDVVGHAQRVSWDTLIKQLQAISAGSKPTVQ